MPDTEKEEEEEEMSDNGEEESLSSQVVQDETRSLVAVLASCRPDTWLMKKRTALITEIQEYVRKHAVARRVLAAWKGM